VTEAQLQAAVADLCKILGLHHYHTRDSRRSQPGFPDSVIAGRSILYRELKNETGKLSVDQRMWGSWLEQAGCDWAVWRPQHWENGVILRQLTQIRKR
jgi:hypothetical protein